jgi:hypothetical protein
VVLCAAAACGGTIRIAPPEPAIQSRCVLTAAPSVAADTAAILFHTLDATREACAQRLVAETLRPWPVASSDPWTVRLTLTAAGVSARRLDSDRARDAIDAGPILMASEDLDLVAYAATRPDLEVAPLPWDRTYLRLSPARESLGAGISPDAVRVDARQASPWECDAAHGDGPSGTADGQSLRILYNAGDRTARELAARIVALSERPDMTAVGVGTAELDALLRAGDDLAYIVSVPSASQCDALAALARKAPWIGAHSIHPLIETRAHSIAPRAVRP